jgi:DnaJ domain
MPLPRSILDPEGYYACLGVPPWAGPETITAAYRREARRVHPDVPKTGDAAAFMALKQAYDVLIHTQRRAAYDRSARQEAAREAEPGEIGPVPTPQMSTPPTRHPRLRDLPVWVWAGMAVVLLVGAIEITLHRVTPQSRVPREEIPAAAREVPPPAPNEPMQPSYGPAPVRLAGTPNFYVVPTSSPAMLWREDDARQTLVPWGTLPPFSAVQGLRLYKANGMVEVKVTDTANGFIEGTRLTPGDTAAAARAWCTYNAGPTPANGEVLSQSAKGRAKLAVDNRSGQPAVVKIRGADGGVIASVFLDPGGQTTLEALPEELARLEYATGEAWSRACHGFAAGMRAQRLPDLAALGSVTHLAIPPDLSLHPVDLSDQAFEQE